MFFFAGVDDRTTPSSVIEAYFKRLHASLKRLFIIPHAAHYLVNEALGIVLKDLIEQVRPLADSASDASKSTFQNPLYSGSEWG